MEDMNSMEEDLGVTEERDFAPEGRRFFKILGRGGPWRFHFLVLLVLN